MSVHLNHTIVHAKNKEESAHFLAEILGLGPPKPFYHFLTVKTDNGVTLDFISTTDEFTIEHYAFLVSESDFDQIFARIKSKGIPFWADPGRSKPNEINTNDGGRGVYFPDPSGHYLEILTSPYGG